MGCTKTGALASERMKGKGVVPREGGRGGFDHTRLDLAPAARAAQGFGNRSWEESGTLKMLTIRFMA